MIERAVTMFRGAQAPRVLAMAPSRLGSLLNRRSLALIIFTECFGKGAETITRGGVRSPAKSI